jgi:hypothetical protein
MGPLTAVIVALLIPLGLTLVMWSFGLLIASKQAEITMHFIRMYIGWLILTIIWLTI